MKRFILVSLASLMSAFSVQAEEAEPLPTPLTLEYVLEQPARMSPTFLRQQASVLQAQAQQMEVTALDSLSFDLLGRLGKREFRNEDQDYNLAALHMGLPLYDFGRTAASEQAWSLDARANEYRLESIEQQFRLDLMRAYFNVLLAEVRYRVENEAMAIAYVTLDKVREAHVIGLASDIELYESEKNYQKVLLKRQRARTDLRRLPMLLVNAMGRTDAILPDLTLPKLTGPPETLLELEDYLRIALDNNPDILAAKQAYDASQYRVESAQAGARPIIRADAWVGQLSSYPEQREGHWQAQVSIDFPLYDGGLNKSQVDRERAQRQETRAGVFEIEQQIREKIMNLYFQLELLAVEKQAVEASQTAADYNLDYKRAIYENELQTDLGNAMVRITQTDYDALEFNLKRALLWAKMQALTGMQNLAEQQKQVSE
ncbi:MAG: TolC family protein [Gammaproteobacteria bacterium]|nr:TolC family protein [Gammaproteobacteria bacterium]